MQQHLLRSFNSTRCIRNRGQECGPAEVVSLSTPHGALGTGYTGLLETVKRLPFNSTRCIRNEELNDRERSLYINFQLHTVHQEREKGLLSDRTQAGFQLHTVHQEPLRERQGGQGFWELSTPHGALGTKANRITSSNIGVFQLHTVHQEPTTNNKYGTTTPIYLSTPHGALGTVKGEPIGKLTLKAFNSTRCIRNQIIKKNYFLFFSNIYFQLHTVHQEPYDQRTLQQALHSFNSTRCIRNI